MLPGTIYFLFSWNKMEVMSDKHSKKRSNALEDDMHSPITSLATSASASLSRKKMKTHADDGAATHNVSTATTTSTSHHTKDKNDIGGHEDVNYTPLSLADIRTRILDLFPRVPTVPEEGINPENTTDVYDWASKMQTVIEEFNLLLCCISPATYKWASDRSGAADQNLGVLSGELGNAQEQISTCLSQRIANILAPVVDLVVKTTDIHVDKETGVQTRTNTFSRELVDPSFLKLNCLILSRNAKMLRQVILANFHKAATSIKDYLEAAKKDNQNEHQRSFAY